MLREERSEPPPPGQAPPAPHDVTAELDDEDVVAQART
jgi:hypothetical protein